MCLLVFCYFLCYSEVKIIRFVCVFWNYFEGKVWRSQCEAVKLHSNTVNQFGTHNVTHTLTNRWENAHTVILLWGRKPSWQQQNMPSGPTDTVRTETTHASARDTHIHKHNSISPRHSSTLTYLSAKSQYQSNSQSFIVRLIKACLSLPVCLFSQFYP